MASSYCFSAGDFVKVRKNLTFQPDERKICVNVPIMDDNNMEPMESFTVGFVPDQGGGFSVGPNPISTVTIVDDDGKAFFSHHINLYNLV